MTDREWELLVHLNDLRVAMEKVYASLDDPYTPIRDEHLKIILDEAYMGVWAGMGHIQEEK